MPPGRIEPKVLVTSHDLKQTIKPLHQQGFYIVWQICILYACGCSIPSHYCYRLHTVTLKHITGHIEPTHLKHDGYGKEREGIQGNGCASSIPLQGTYF